MAESTPRRHGAAVTFLAVLAAFAVLVALGSWQLERRAWKNDLIAVMDYRLALPPAPLEELLTQDFAAPQAIDFRPVRVTGRFLHDHELYLAARTHEGRLGYHVVTPLLIAGALGEGSQVESRPIESQRAVLVDRGWVPNDRQAPETRPAGQVAGTVTVEGILRRPSPPGLFTPDNQPERNLWYWPDLPAMVAHVGLPRLAASVYIEAAPSAVPGGLPIGGQTRIHLANNHLQYAITWYALALALAVLYLVSRRRSGSGTSFHSSSS